MYIIHIFDLSSNIFVASSPYYTSLLQLFFLLLRTSSSCSYSSSSSSSSSFSSSSGLSTSRSYMQITKMRPQFSYIKHFNFTHTKKISRIPRFNVTFYWVPRLALFCLPSCWWLVTHKPPSEWQLSKNQWRWIGNTSLEFLFALLFKVAEGRGEVHGRERDKAASVESITV